MAKSRAQRKAEQRKRRELEAAQGSGNGSASTSAAQHDTQVPESGEVAEVEAAMEAGAARADVLSDEASAASAEPVEPVELVELVAAEEEIPGEDRISRRDRRRQEKERERQMREQAERRTKKPEAAVRERGPIMSFLNSVTRELGRVQWPDRDTLVQASAVTLLFVIVAATYLGILDGIFNWLVDKLLI